MKYKLMLCYDGGRYKGWQRQKNIANTIQGKIEDTLSRTLGRQTEVAGCGRTDAGVHARVQICSFTAETDMSCDEILDQLRKFLPEDIGAISIEHADPGFHARLSCKEKTYVYRIWNSSVPNVFERKFAYTYPNQLDIDKMRDGSKLLMGTHDFSSFSSAKKTKKSTVRSIYDIEIEKCGDLITIAITGNGFLYNMVRIVVGTLIEIGNGSREAESIVSIFESKKRENAGFTAPANGLFLWNIKY
jgi:tRNA pseudouridine38-40 synthase